jgi:hypothetical protein
MDKCQEPSIFHGHRQTDRAGFPERQGRKLSFSERIRRPSGFFTDQFVEGKSDEATSVMATLRNGTTRPLAEAVQSVLFLWKKIKGKRIISPSLDLHAAIKYKTQSRECPPRKARCRIPAPSSEAVACRIAPPCHVIFHDP